MRLSILSATMLAFASAAPLGLPTSPVLVPGAFVFPAAVATIPSGDIQAAFIDAKVQAEDQVRLLEDQARAAADQARLIADQTRFFAEQAKEQPQLKVKETNEISGTFVFPAAVATIPSGDIQAAFIDAKVQAEDQVRLLEDQARAAADQARLTADQTRFLAEQAKEQPQLKAKATSEVSGASVLPAEVATISPGDVQAAFIDAKVQAEDRFRLIEDQARAAADQARLIADQTRFFAEQAKEQLQLKVKETNEISGAFVFPAAVATIPSGDIQAAFIDAKVQAQDQVRLLEDQARAAADQARLTADQARLLVEQATKQPQLKVKGTNEISGTFVLPAAIATMSPGDIQAALIDAKVQAEDRVRLIKDQAQAVADEARLIADQARLLAEQAKEQARPAVEKTNEKLDGINEHTNEKALEAFLFLEEQKRQVVEALKIVEAKVNEAIAKDPSLLAEHTGSGTVLSPNIDALFFPFSGSAYTYTTPEIVAPAVKSTTDTETSPVETETNKVVAPDSSEKTEVTVKTASVTDESKAQETIGGNTESLTKCNQLKNALAEETSEPQQIVPASTDT